VTVNVSPNRIPSRDRAFCLIENLLCRSAVQRLQRMVRWADLGPARFDFCVKYLCRHGTDLFDHPAEHAV
jgi:hypothetical protein